MAANQPDPAMRAIATFLNDNPGLHDLDAITTAAGVSKPVAGKVLKHLVDSKPPIVELDATDPKRKRWAWVLPAPTNTEPEDPHGDDAAEPDRPEEAPKPAPEAPSETDSEPPAADSAAADPRPEPAGTDAPSAGPEQGTEPAADSDSAPVTDAENGGRDAEGVSIQPVLLEHDPMVMYMARALADAAEPLTTRQVAEAAYMPMGTREVLTALRALHAKGLATCSKPFSPSDEDCTWQRQEGMEPDAFMRSARGVPMSAAPDHVTCPTCGHRAAIPGVAKSRKRNSDLRSDGTRKLPAGGLKRLAKEWLSQPENAGVLITPGQLKRALITKHGSTINPNCDGALRQLMADQFTKEDPTDNDKRPLLVEEEGVKPLTYAIRDAIA
ncbi:hypothetical protein [Glycomyces sp. NPDC047010]|uniref:hypothetical protein n=1 Tax=Glycomyces sp. NPDC047010 TaxID=3155023 RepID=UPI00340FEA2C